MKIDWNELAAPKQISNADLASAVGDAYDRGLDARPILQLIFKFSPGGSSRIPQGRRLEFIRSLGQLMS
jgi:hypothetical protein